MRPHLRVPATLTRIDDAVVPGLLRGLRRVQGVLAAPLRGVRRWEDRVAEGRLVHTLVRARRGVLLVTVLIAFLGSAVHLQRYPDLRQAQREAAAAAREQTVTLPGEGTPAGAGQTDGAAVVGPPIGVDLAEYAARRAEALAALPAEGSPLVAVVSLRDYRAAEAVAALLPDGVTVHLAQYRIPAQGEPPLQTEVVGGDLVASMARAVAAAREPIASEEDEVATLLASGTVEDERFVEDLEARLSELRAVKNLLDTGAGVVFAVVVEGPVDVLQTLAGADGVRLVDPAPPGTDIDVSSFYGVRPEDGAVATYGRRG